MSLLSFGGSAAAFFIAIKRVEWGAWMTNDYLSYWNYGYKAIEIFFAGVYITFLGQVLTRRAFSKTSKAFNIAEMTMRNWVIQPGSIVSHYEGFPHAGMSLLGGITILATLSALFYTSACNSLITPQILWTSWKEDQTISTFARSSYANIDYIKSSCPSIDSAVNDKEYGASCIIMRVNGESYRTLLAYLGDWQNSEFPAGHPRPGARTIIMGNTTLSSAWIDDGSPIVAEVDGRIINNVTLAMPHAGLSILYSHAYSTPGDLRQPGDATGFNEYDLGASVVAPSINVLCATAQESEVEPLLGQKDGKAKESPLDDVFHWGKKYNGRYRPAFEVVSMI
jgi:hypothetical protein